MVTRLFLKVHVRVDSIFYVTVHLATAARTAVWGRGVVLINAHHTPFHSIHYTHPSQNSSPPNPLKSERNSREALRFSRSASPVSIMATQQHCIQYYTSRACICMASADDVIPNAHAYNRRILDSVNIHITRKPKASNFRAITVSVVCLQFLKHLSMYQWMQELNQ